MPRILAVDWGERRIGLAVSDPEAIIATGLATTEPELEDVLKALGASKLDILWNVGLPRTMPFFSASLKVAIPIFRGAVRLDGGEPAVAEPPAGEPAQAS